MTSNHQGCHHAPVWDSIRSEIPKTKKASGSPNVKGLDVLHEIHRHNKTALMVTQSAASKKLKEAVKFTAAA